MAVKDTYRSRTFAARTFASRTWGPRVSVPSPVYQPPLIWPAGPSREQLEEISKPKPRSELRHWRHKATVSLGFVASATITLSPGLRPVEARPHWHHASVARLGMRAGFAWAFRDPLRKQRLEEDEWLLGVGNLT